MAGNFIEQLTRRQQAGALRPPPTTEKPVEQMSGEELDEALNRARQDLLDARHTELRERELARIQKPAGGAEAGPRTLSDVLREKQRDKRRTWTYHGGL
jgi:hypothetical protein